MYNANASKFATMFEIHRMPYLSLCVSFESSLSNFNYIAFSHFELVDGQAPWDVCLMKM